MGSQPVCVAPPAAPEVCDLEDNDCDGVVDECPGMFTCISLPMVAAHCGCTFPSQCDGGGNTVMPGCMQGQCYFKSANSPIGSGNYCNPGEWVREDVCQFPP